MTDMIERKQVVGYLRFLAKNASLVDRLASAEGETAGSILCSGLESAAKQVEEGIIDAADWSDEA